MNSNLKKLKKLCRLECNYYLRNLDLIAASSFLRPRIAYLQDYKIQRSMEGLLNKRPYAGTKYLDKIESIGVEAAKRIFKAEAVNIQPHSGSQANQAAYTAFLKPGDKVLSMRFDAGGHLTHGNPINFSGKIYHFEYYGINPRTQLIDYELLKRKVKEFKPKMIVAGASSYPRIIDYQLISKIAKKNMSYFMVDIAHPVGLIASNLHPSPVPYADVVTTSTEKTLWGPHAGMIMTKKAFKNQVDQAVHPGTQSSVPINRIIQVALALLFAETSEFKDYASRVAKNAQVLADNFSRIENCLLFGGTDSHFVVIDVLGGFGLSGKEAEKVLEEIGIFTNRQVIPWEERRVYETSGLRIGTPSASARGLTEKDFDLISKAMINVLKNPEDVMVKQDAKEKVEKIAANHIPDFCGEY